MTVTVIAAEGETDPLVLAAEERDELSQQHKQQPHHDNSNNKKGKSTKRTKRRRKVVPRRGSVFVCVHLLSFSALCLPVAVLLYLTTKINRQTKG